jgi:hypothetical protein
VLNQKIVHAQKPGETIPKHDVAHFPKVQPYQNSAQKQPIQIIKQPFQIKNFGKIRLGANHYCPKKHHLHFQK